MFYHLKVDNTCIYHKNKLNNKLSQSQNITISQYNNNNQFYII